MKVDPYLHAVLVLHGAGKEITKENIISVLSSAGVQVDEARAKVLSEAVAGLNFDELLKSAAVPVVSSPSGSKEGGEKEEKKKEVAEEGKKEEATAEGLAALFG
ncbi:MAG: 50S ribosomal protein L12 [Candidatus Anstonellales archaeon]